MKWGTKAELTQSNGCSPKLLNLSLKYGQMAPGLPATHLQCRVSAHTVTSVGQPQPLRAKDPEEPLLLRALKQEGEPRTCHQHHTVSVHTHNTASTHISEALQASAGDPRR